MDALHLQAIGMPGTPELLIIAVLVLLIFGPKKLPELFKSIGSAVHSFREGLSGKFEDQPENTNLENNSDENENADPVSPPKIKPPTESEST